MLRLFAAARDAAGTGRVDIPASTVGELLREARSRFGPAFGEVLASSKVWVNGEPAGESRAVGEDDEVAVIPPVSGG